MNPVKAKTGRKSPTDAQRMFARMVIAGKTHVDAWLIAYPKAKRGNPKQNGDRANDVHKSEGVQGLLRNAKRKADPELLLTINRRLAICAAIATDETAKPAEKLMAVRVYGEVGGDRAPDPAQEVIVKGDPNAPIVAVNVDAPRRSVREIMAGIHAARAARKAATGEDFFIGVNGSAAVNGNGKHP